MVTLFEINAVNEFADWYVSMVVDAIKNKPIQRKGRGQGEFQAPVNASGALANSIRKEITKEEIRIYALNYIDNVVFGVPPRKSDFSLFEIEQWLAVKGLDFSPVNVATNIDRYGTSIYQQHAGNNSGLLSDIPLEQRLEELKQKLILMSVDSVLDELTNPWKEVAA